ncbi:MAG: trypsin-like peptidase domain-containing protein [Pirellulales bacterium]|nr:trypsin-like peptidase domain-containing protein [Pirellulales bacterium]
MNNGKSRVIGRAMFVGCATAAFAGLVLCVGDLGPAGIVWSRLASGALGAVLAAGASLAGSQFAYRSLCKVELQSALRRGGALAVAATLIYLVLFTAYTEVPMGVATRLPVGLAYSDEFRDLLAENVGAVAVTKEEFAYDLQRIYRPWSLHLSMALVLLSWTVMFAGWGAFVVALVRSHLLRSSFVGVVIQHGGESDFSGQQTRRQLERTVKQRIPQVSSAVWRSRQTAVEGQVGRVEYDGAPVGTGFLVGPDALLTNYHVAESWLDNPAAARLVAVRFDHKVAADNVLASGVVVRLHPDQWLLDASPYAPCEKRSGAAGRPQNHELDYALLRLARPIGDEEYSPDAYSNPRRRGWIELPDHLPELPLRAPLVIVQHPHGAPQTLALDSEAFLGFTAERNRMRYTTNTESGSSGSPVFDFRWTLIALHHLGDPAFDDLSPEYNQGIPANVINRLIMDPGRPGVLERSAAISRAL